MPGKHLMFSALIAIERKELRTHFVLTNHSPAIRAFEIHQLFGDDQILQLILNDQLRMTAFENHRNKHKGTSRPLDLFCLQVPPHVKTCRFKISSDSPKRHNEIRPITALASSPPGIQRLHIITLRNPCPLVRDWPSPGIGDHL